MLMVSQSTASWYSKSFPFSCHESKLSRVLGVSLSGGGRCLHNRRRETGGYAKVVMGGV